MTIVNTAQAGQSVVVWADPHRVELVRDLLGRLPQMRVLAAGGPRKTQEIADLAASFDAEIAEDLRAMVRGCKPAWVILASSMDVKAAELQHACASGATLLSIEPPHPDTIESGVTLTPAIWLRLSRSWLSAADPQQALGRIESMQLNCLASASAGSLYARLYDAMDLLLHLRGVPESIDACLTGPLKHPPDDLRALTGHMTLHIRHGVESSATALLSDRAPAWNRRLIVIGSEAQLILEDKGYRLINKEGGELDHLVDLQAPQDPAELIAAQWKHLLGGGQLPPAVDPQAIAACCRAALLSCRTGQSEQPARMLSIARV